MNAPASPRQPLIRPVVALALCAAALVPAAAVAKAPYSAVAGPDRADANFSVSYRGAGTWRTRFHATPPNDGGKADTNDAHDTSRQAWKLKFRNDLFVPTCGQPTDGGEDPCARVTGTTGAVGPTDIRGRVNHKHVDGLYRQLNRTVKCGLRKRTSKRRQDATVSVRYLPESDSFGVTTRNPLKTTMSFFPGQCPKQGDSIDRILDFYAPPGFSFDPAFDADRWFTSSEVVIPAAVFHGSKTITIPVADTPAGTPPRRCAVPNPSYERCKTGGAWSGVLTLKAKDAPIQSVQRVRAAKVRPPRKGIYEGAHGVVLSVSAKSIDLAAFDFKCKKTIGRANLNAIAIKRSHKRYRFAIRAHGSVSYRDDHPDQNASISFAGRFSSTGKSARGTLRVKSAHCGDSGSVNWSARR